MATATTAALPSYTTVRPPDTVLARRRLVALLVTLVALASVAMVAVRAAAALGGSPASPLERRPAVSVVVQPGDSLWSIAQRLDPDGDVRALVHRLAELNGGTSLDVGQRLVLP